MQVDTKNQQDSKSKRQMLTTQFENLKTGDEENFEILMQSYVTFNASYALGKNIDVKLVRKILRSLPPKFESKVTTI